MELWQHALYALAIVVVALIGWRAWRNEAEAVITIGKSRDRIAIDYDDMERCFHEVDALRVGNYRLYTQYVGMYKEKDGLYRKAEQSRRAYKGHNTRLRSENRALKERIAELEGEG